MPNAYSLPYEAPYIGLPVNAIAQAAQSVQEKEDFARDALDEMERALRTAAIAPQDQPHFQQLVQGYRNRIQEISDRGFAFDRLRSIRSMARDAGDEIAHLQSNYAGLQKNLQEIEAMENTPREVRDLYKQDLLSQYQGGFNEAGRVDYTRTFSPRSYAQAADFGKILEDAADAFKRDFRNFSWSEDGRYIVTTEGENIDPAQLGQHLLTRLRSNPEAQSYLSDLRRVAGDEYVDSLVQEQVTQAVLARANPNVKQNIKADPYRLRLFGEQLYRDRPKEQKEGGGGFYMIPGSARNLAEGYRDLRKRIDSAPDPVSQDRMELIYEGMMNRFETRLPEGVSRSEFEQYLEDRNRPTDSIWGRFPTIMGPVGGSSEHINRLSQTDSFLKRKELKSNYDNYDRLEQAAKQFDEFIQGEGIRDYTIVPTAETDQPVQDYFNRVVRRRFDLFTTGDVKQDKKLRDAAGDGRVAFIGASYSDTFGREIELAVQPEEGGAEEVIRLQVKDTGQAGRLGRDSIDQLFQLMGANDVVEETKLDYLQVGKDWIGDETFQLRRNTEGVVPGIIRNGETQPVTGRVFVEKLQQIQRNSGLSKEDIIQLAAPFFQEIANQSRSLSGQDIYNWALGGELPPGKIDDLAKAFEKELSMSKAKARDLSYLLNSQ